MAQGLDAHQDEQCRPDSHLFLGGIDFIVFALCNRYRTCRIDVQESEMMELEYYLL